MQFTSVGNIMLFSRSITRHILGNGRKQSKCPQINNALLRRFASLPTRQNLNLDGRVALVTGGTNGIGLAIARRLAENGAKVVVSSRKQANVDRAVAELQADGLQVSGFPCHFGKEEDRKDLISQVLSSHGDVNIVVQNAGVNPHMIGILHTPVSALDKTYELHIRGNFQFVQELFPPMKISKKPCSIILTSSITAYIPSMYPGAYAITKTAVNAMTRAFAPDLNEHNIRLNCITIGTISTDFLEEAQKNEEVYNKFLHYATMKRFGRPGEVAGMAAYLASDDSSYVTGESFTVSGGLCTRL